LPRSAQPACPGLPIRENASFAEVARLKVPGGRDCYSSTKLLKLLDTLGDTASDTQQTIQELWEERNILDQGKNFLFADKTLTDVLRWHHCGLSVNAIVKKVRTSYEIERNCVPQ